MAAVKEVYLKLNEEQSKVLKEDLEKLEKDLEVAEKRAEEAEKKEDAMYEEFQADIKRQLDGKFQEFKGGSSSAGLGDIQDRLYASHIDETSKLIKNTQNELMRTNKVIKEVSRGIATDWQAVFEYLMSAQLSKSEIKQQISRIEKQNRPLMQAYKALILWRDMKDDTHGLTHLADALRLNKKLDLADYVLDAIDCEGDSFHQLKAPGEEAKPGEGAQGGEDGAKPSMKQAQSRTGALDDRKFLQLARKIGAEWEPIATTLGLAEEDVKEILEGEGKTYQGAFKMLWTWRDRTVELDQDSAQILQEALKACGKDDVAELV